MLGSECFRSPWFRCWGGRFAFVAYLLVPPNTLLLEWAVCLAVLVMVLLVRGLGLLAVLRRWVIPVRSCCHSGHLVDISIFRVGLVGLGLFLEVSARFVLSGLELVGVRGEWHVRQLHRSEEGRLSFCARGE